MFAYGALSVKNRGSTRVTLAAGQSKPVRIEVTVAQLAFQDDSSAAGKFSVVNGDYQVRVGDSSMTDTL